MCTRAPRGSGFRKERIHSPRERTGRERIVESNIRRTFTVRFPNLYCVWQRCRDIRGSYRNVLLLIVLHPEGNGGRGRRVAARPTKTENRGRGTVREDERQKRVIPRGEISCEREKKRERAQRLHVRERKREREKEKENRERERARMRERQRKRGSERERSENTACTGAFDRPMNWIIASRVESRGSAKSQSPIRRYMDVDARTRPRMCVHVFACAHKNIYAIYKYIAGGEGGERFYIARRLWARWK